MIYSRLKVRHTCWCTPQSRLSSSWPLWDQCMSITRFVRAVSPSLVGHVHVHTLTVSVQVVGGQVEGKNHGPRLQDGVFIWCFTFLFELQMFLEDIRIFFCRVRSKQEDLNAKKKKSNFFCFCSLYHNYYDKRFSLMMLWSSMGSQDLFISHCRWISEPLIYSEMFTVQVMD